MQSNICVLDTKAKAKAEVVEMAEEIMLMAENGEIVDLCWFAVGVDGATNSRYSSTEDNPRRLAAASRLVHRLQLAMDD